MNEQDFGLKLRALRHERGETLEQVSEATGLSVAMLSRVERGERLPSPDSVETLARHFALSADDLMSETIANRMLNRYGRESTQRAAERMRGESGEAAEAGALPLRHQRWEPEADVLAHRLRARREDAPSAPQAAEISNEPSAVRHRYGAFSAMPLLDALQPQAAMASHSDHRGGSTIEVGLARELSGGSLPAGDLDRATRQALGAARQSGDLAAMLAERDMPDLSAAAKLELIAELAKLVESPAGVLRRLASEDDDERVRRAAEGALRGLGG